MVECRQQDVTLHDHLVQVSVGMQMQLLLTE